MRTCVWGVFIAALLLPAIASSTPLEISVPKLGSTPMGAVVVRSLAKHCRQHHRERCASLLRRYLRQRKLHPLTRAALQRELAQELRAAGDREAGSELTADLHYLRTFSLALPAGDMVTLHADPVSGTINVADFVELTTDLPRSFRATLHSNSAQTLYFLVTGSHLERVCLGKVCTVVAPMNRSFPDQFLMQARLAPAPASNDLELVFSPQAPVVNFGFRIVHANFTPVAAESLEDNGPPAYQIRTAKSGRMPVAPISGPVAWLPEIAEKPSLQLLLTHCLAAEETGRSAGEVADRLFLQADQLSADHWSHFISCLSHDERELEAVRQARKRFPDDRRFTIAEAEYRSRQKQFQRAWQLLSGLGQFPSLEDFANEELGDVMRILRNVLPSFDLSSLLQQCLVKAQQRLPHDSELAVAAAEQLLEDERHFEAVTLLAPFVKRWPGDDLAANTHAFILDRLGRFEQESAILERLSWLYPTRTLTLESLASAKERAGELEAADKLHLTLFEKGRYQPYLLGRAASYFFRRGERTKAVELWQRVVELQPQNREIRALLERLQVHGVSMQEAPLATDEERRKLANELPDADGVPRQGVLDRTHLRLYENGANILRRSVTILVDDAGAGAPFDFRFTYDSHLEEAIVSRAEVLRQDGTVAPAAEVGDHSLSSEEYNLYYDLRQMVVRFDDLQAGDLAVVTYEVEADPSSLGGPFSGVFWFQEEYPKNNVELVIAVPTGKEVYSTIGPATQAGLLHQTIDDGDTQRTWRFSVAALAAEESEPFAPGPFERSLFLHYSTTETWQQFTAWYATVIAHVGGLDSAMERLLERVTKGSRKPREIAEDIARYVADDVRYVGLELGVHGLQPYPPQEVFARGYGDCKDKSLLYVTLLAAAGIEARLVVVPTLPRGKVDLSPGSPSIFDHAIVYLPKWDIFFDPTARYLGLGTLPWQNQGVEAIIVDVQEPRRVVLPVSPHTETVIRIELDVDSVDEGELAVVGTLSFSGQFAWRLLGAMEQQGSWSNTVESYLSSVLPVVEVTSINERVERGASPTVVIEIEGIWRIQDKGGVQLLPDGNAAFAIVKRPNREQPLVFGFPYEQDFSVTFGPGTLTFPDGGFDASQNEEAAWKVGVVSLDDGRLQVAVKFEQRARRIAVERYEEFRTQVVRYQEALARLRGIRGEP
jgi:tetratricopeptide (TPR) repeat protein